MELATVRCVSCFKKLRLPMPVLALIALVNANVWETGTVRFPEIRDPQAFSSIPWIQPTVSIGVASNLCEV